MVKQLSIVVGLCILGFLTWRLGMSLSSDALGMAVGVVFGVLAGVPSALLVLASSRRRERDDDDDVVTPAVHITYNVTHNTDNRQLTINHAAGSMPLLADREREVQAQRAGRVFRVVGEREGGDTWTQ